MTILDPVIHFLLTASGNMVTLIEVIEATERPRRPVLRALDKLAKEGYLQELPGTLLSPGFREYGPKRRNPSWKIISDLTGRPTSRSVKTSLRAKVWKLIRAKRHFTKADLVITSGINPATVDDYVRALERMGYVRRTGKDGTRVTYMLVKNVIDYPKVKEVQHG